MRPALTDQQAKLLKFIQDHIHRQGHPPTFREIGRAFRFRSTGTVRDHIQAIEAKGYLRKSAGKSRGLFPENLWRALPILGRVPAGGPLLAEENIEGTFDLTEEFRGEKTFALKVRGDSMEEAGIHDGDLVVVRAQEDAEPDQIVVALVEGEATVKRLFRRAGKLQLQPANPRYEPIPVETSTKILGKVIGVIRSYERRF